ncbi:hypothetical protein CNR22_00680 [Sphingobacteriaceae bacterium]|nr:hypothetical protein CNR22_00680 [Sphingobacteriaceae bacterium]
MMGADLSKILAFNKALLQDRVEHKYALMNKSFYRFFRGTCHLYYDSLAKEKELPFSPNAWICGDLHMENFGSYKGNNRLVYFDLNDFDEAILAPVSWELIHFVSSIFIAFDSLNLASKKAYNMSRLFLKVYSETLARGKSFYIEPHSASGIVCDFLTAVSRRKQKDLLDKRTFKKGNKRFLNTDAKYLPLGQPEKQELCTHMDEWILNNSGRPYNYEVIDAVFRIAGIGSLGLKRYLFLLKSTNVKEKYLLLDMKESRTSSLAKVLKIKQPSWANESERIIAIQQRMQNIVPFLLSTTVFKGTAYVLQELQPTKDSINLKLIKHEYRKIYKVVNDMAVLAASAQLRSAGRQNSASADELILFGENTNWQEPIINCAVRQTEILAKKYEAFKVWYTLRSSTPKRSSTN